MKRIQRVGLQWMIIGTGEMFGSKDFLFQFIGLFMLMVGSIMFIKD